MKLKGHTTIELRDVVTGEVKKYEDDNMFTDAISKMVNFAAKHSLGSNPLDVYSAHWNNLLGGLVLFDSTHTEDADNIYPHGGVKPVGCGQVGNTSNYASFLAWGVYNSSESDTSATDMKVMVWDFATDHANGTIASVSLTHKNAGLFGMGTASENRTQTKNYGKIALGNILTQGEKGKASVTDTNYGTTGSSILLTDGSYVDFCIDSENDEKYMFKVCNDGLSIIKHKMYPEKFDVFRSSTYYQECIEETYAETFSGTYFFGFYNTDEKVLYFWLDSDNSHRWSAATTKPIHKFDMTTKTLTANWKNASLLTSSPYKNFWVTASAMYYYSQTDYKIRKYTFTSGETTEICTLINGTDTSVRRRSGFIINDILYLGGCTNSNTSYDPLYEAMIDLTDDSFRYTNVMNNLQRSASQGYIGSNFGHEIPPIDNTQIVIGTMNNAGNNCQNMVNMQQSGESYSQIGNAFAWCGYLGTINNLSTPIVKTAQQTMKVTYTITAESE